MKKVEAIIKPFKLDEVKNALQPHSAQKRELHRIEQTSKVLRKHKETPFKLARNAFKTG